MLLGAGALERFYIAIDLLLALYMFINYHTKTARAKFDTWLWASAPGREWISALGKIIKKNGSSNKR